MYINLALPTILLIFVLFRYILPLSQARQPGTAQIIKMKDRKVSTNIFEEESRYGCIIPKMLK
jgi:hypothetical protein